MKELWIKKTIWRRYLIIDRDRIQVEHILREARNERATEMIDDFFDKNKKIEYDNEKAIFPPQFEIKDIYSSEWYSMLTVEGGEVNKMKMRVNCSGKCFTSKSTYVTVHVDNGKAFGQRGVKVNWSTIGAVSIEKANNFIAELKEAVRVAKKESKKLSAEIIKERKKC